ncbi:MAG TPA: tetratricopeptide repeat protein [Rhizomicrobium sp.]
MHLNFSARAASAAVVLLCGLTAGCTTTTETGVVPGTKGFDAYMRGDYTTAMQTFQSEEQQYPNNPYVQFNIADTYAATGHRDDAIRYYKMVLASGRETYPTTITEANKAEALAIAACDHLTSMSVSCN